jgi:hypothetical protein
MKFSVQEIGIYERMVDQLRLTHPDQEIAIEQAHRFLMENSEEITKGVGLQKCNSKAGNFTASSDI